MARSTKSGSPASGTVTVIEGGVITRVSRAVHHLCGVNAEDLIGHSIKLLLPAERSRMAKEIADLLEQKELSKREMRHRVVNSLQMIASILMIKARKVESEETRLQMEDAHLRIIAIAEMQKLLEINEKSHGVEIVPYLTQLGLSLEAAMIHGRPITLKVVGQCNKPTDGQTAVALGLITTELVINALKYAFEKDTAGAITVSYECNGDGWNLTVSDDGIGILDTDLYQGWAVRF